MTNKTYLHQSEQTFTIPSCRYYFDEHGNCPALDETFERYNRMAEWAYNYMYDEEFLEVSHEKGFTQSAKDYYAKTYHSRLTDYYCNSLFTRASGLIRSQKELLKLYGQENEMRVAACMEKAKKIRESLEVHQKIKAYLVARSRAFTKGTPAPDEKVPKEYKFFIREDPSGDHKKDDICLSARKGALWLKLYSYECDLDRKIRAEKQRISQILEKAKRLEAKQFQVPRRATFGGRAAYRKKDTMGYDAAQMKEWHVRRDKARNSRINFSGRHTSKYGNFQCRYDVKKGTVDITLLDGSVFRMEGVSFPYRGDELKEYLENREGSVGYVLEKRADGNGRQYLVLKATVTRTNSHTNTYMGAGCVAFDTNADCLAWCELDGNGNRLRTGTVPFSLDGLNSSQTTQALAKAVAQVVRIADDSKKPVAMEDLDFFRKKAAMAYRDESYNRMLSAFAYAKITELTQAACYKNSIGLYIVPPAYTSLIAKLKYMRPLGTTIHEAAAYVIGRRALGINERIPAYLRAVMPKKTGRGSYWTIWNTVQKHSPPLPWRMFRKKIPVFRKWDGFREALVT